MRCCATPASSPIAVASQPRVERRVADRAGERRLLAQPPRAVDRARRRQLAAIARRVRKRPEDPHPVRRDARLVLERAVRDDLRMGGQHAHHGRRARAAQRRQQQRLQAWLEGAAQRRARPSHQRQRQPASRPSAAPRAAARTRGSSERALSVPKNPLRCACGRSGWAAATSGRSISTGRRRSRSAVAQHQHRGDRRLRADHPAPQVERVRVGRDAGAGESRAQSPPVRRPAERATPR